MENKVNLRSFIPKSLRPDVVGNLKSTAFVNPSEEVLKTFNTMSIEQIKSLGTRRQIIASILSGIEFLEIDEKDYIDVINIFV